MLRLAWRSGGRLRRGLKALSVVLSLSVGAASLVHAAPALLATARFSADVTGLDPLLSLAIVRASASGAVLADLEAAVASDELDLAESLLALADSRDIAVPADLRDRVAALGSGWNVARRGVEDFGSGAVTGEVDSMAGLAGLVAADLTLVGDLRDLGRAAVAHAAGEEVDWLVTSIALVGLALSGSALASLLATPATGGAAAPAAGAAVSARSGLSLVKAVAKASGRAAAAGGRGLRHAVEPLLRGVVDPAMLKRAVADVDLLSPRATIAAAEAAVDWRRVDRLVDLGRDFSRIEAVGGPRGVLWLGRSMRTLDEVPLVAGRLERLGARSLAVTTRAGEALLARGWRLAGLVADVLAAAVAALLATMHLAFIVAKLAVRLVFRLFRRRPGSRRVRPPSASRTGISGP